jgi:hypothetical protein
MRDENEPRLRRNAAGGNRMITGSPDPDRPTTATLGLVLAGDPNGVPVPALIEPVLGARHAA